MTSALGLLGCEGSGEGIVTWAVGLLEFDGFGEGSVTWAFGLLVCVSWSWEVAGNVLQGLWESW